jgi:hypothetical protein
VLVLAHAGHWLPQLIYLVPLLVLIAVIVTGRVRDRREAANDQVRAQSDECGLTSAAAGNHAA